MKDLLTYVTYGQFGFADELMKLAEDAPKMLHVPVAEADKPPPPATQKPRVRRRYKPPTPSVPKVPSSKHPDYRMVPGGWQQRTLGPSGTWTTHKGTPPAHVMKFVREGPYDPPPESWREIVRSGKHKGGKIDTRDVTYQRSRGGAEDPAALQRFEKLRVDSYARTDPKKAWGIYKKSPELGEPPEKLRKRVESIWRGEKAESEARAKRKTERIIRISDKLGRMGH